MTRIRAELIVRDDLLQGIIKRSNQFPALTVESGILDTDSAIAEYALYNEFGTRDIPSRSFLRSTFDENLNDYENFLINAVANLTDARSRSPRTVMVQLGARIRNDIVKKITRLRNPPNAPSTIAQKGFDNPLIDTGAMRNAVRSRVIEE